MMSLLFCVCCMGTKSIDNGVDEMGWDGMRWECSAPKDP
jgi:hypothetical protein